MKTLKIARYQLKDVFRSRWILFYSLFFLAVTDALFRFGGGGERVLLSLMNVVLIAVPLVSAVLGAMYLYGSREFVELMLTQPIRRSSLFSGLFIGLAAPLCAAFAFGVAAPFAYHGGFADGAGGAVLLLVGTGVVLTLVFTALAFLIALLAEDRLRGLGVVLVLWLGFALVYDGLVLTAVHAFADYPMERVVIGLSLLNPIDLGRILLLLDFEISALMGFTGAVFQRFFGSAAGQAITAGALMLWLAVPLLLGLRAFRLKDL